MPDARELLTTRRSFKAVELTGPPPSAGEIDTLLTIASRVPDHGKLAPWRFIVFEGEARRAAGEAIAAAFRAEYPKCGARASRARSARDRRGEPRQPACEKSRNGSRCSPPAPPL
jgi:nitroreductase